MAQDRLDNWGGSVIAHVDADLRVLIPSFLEQIWKDVHAIIDGLKQGDYENIRMLGHNIKGTGGAYGFYAIRDLGRFLEQAAKEKNQAEIRKLVQELKNYLERVEILYE